MYILSDRFLGNINNGKLSYMDGNIFKYTNDGVNYRECVIGKKDIYEGALKDFFVKVNVYPWMEDKIYSQIKDYIDTDDDSLYLNVKITKENKVDEVMIVQSESVDYSKLVELNEVVCPVVKDKKTTVLGLCREGYLVGLEDEPDDNVKMKYSCNICFPEMVYHKAINKYIFKTAEVFGYSSR